MKKYGGSIALFVLLVAACAPGQSWNEFRLVPATVDENPLLPSVTIHVAGYDRKVHFLTFGNPSLPPLFILHGSLSDMRPYLPLTVLSNEYYCVMWDLRGNGLSERVGKSELSYASMVEEIKAMKELFAPTNQIAIMGHSWSAVFVAMYVGKYHADVSQAILMEPIGLQSDPMNDMESVLNLATSAYLDMSYSSDILSPSTHELLDFKMLAMIKSAVRNFFVDKNNLPPWPVWRVGGLALIVWETECLSGGKFSYDFTSGLDTFPGSVLLIGSDHSPIGYDFQLKYNKTFFSNANVLVIPNSGHRIVTENFQALYEGLTNFLIEF
ncbi:MAG: hypothetical protein A2014_12825 [Spirochaetes bacterium GWF1_49_6]|nr:MAG: hypothetical protein A2014_12825 [Spirochaetes bacterium GWF1_49_6]